MCPLPGEHGDGEHQRPKAVDSNQTETETLGATRPRVEDPDSPAETGDPGAPEGHDDPVGRVGGLHRDPTERPDRPVFRHRRFRKRDRRCGGASHKQYDDADRLAGG